VATPLADLDELVLRCRDDRARSLISEAVSGYKAGAFRSAIVATWVAVCFDFIEKLRELALAGDASAEKQIERLEKIRTSDDVSGALAFERDLLKLARDQFEFISPIEYVDLQRLQVDRNRCAHPSLIDEASPYKPSAELVRAHIVAAVDHALRHPPAQGKFALNKLLSQVASEYFPTNEKGALEALRSGPLAKARESLVRNFVVVLLKDIFVALGPERARKIAALKAVNALHPGPYKQAVTEKASLLIRSLADESLSLALVPVDEIPHIQESLGADVSQRLASFVRRLPSGHMNSLEWLVGSSYFGEDARSRASRATRKELKNSFFFSISGAIADRYVDIYLQSSSFDEANDWAKEIIGNIDDFDRQQILKLVVGGAENPEITGSYRFSDVIHAARKAGQVSSDELDNALKSSGLGEYASDDSDMPF
jgi:hypothetical protein